MKFETKRELNSALGSLIESILRDPLRFQDIEEMSQTCGYSRFHLTRVFQELTGEPLYGFLRRIRLERAAFMLREGQNVMQAARTAGFESSEAFCRAFTKEFQLPPSRFKTSTRSWQIHSIENLHWNPQWDPQTNINSLAIKYPTTITRVEPARFAVVRAVGSYSQLSDLWQHVPFLEDKNWVTIYHDNMWTSPNRELMRSDLGFRLYEKEVPLGFKEITIPGGLVLKTTKFIRRSDRNDAWSYLSGCWPNHKWGWDEYSNHPLPFESVMTRICILIGN